MPSPTGNVPLAQALGQITIAVMHSCGEEGKGCQNDRFVWELAARLRLPVLAEFVYRWPWEVAMLQPYDPTLKAMVDAAPADWLELIDRPRALVELLDADVSVTRGAADKVMRVQTEPPWLLHLEFEAGHDSARLPRRTWVCNAVLDERHELPVHSAAVLLCREADSPAVTGEYRRQVEGQPPHQVFRFDVVRVWMLSPERLLAGGLGTLPLAPVSAVATADVPAVIGRMKERLATREAKPLARDLWAATFVLLGLRHSSEMAAALLRGVLTMKESTTYQMILEEGRVEGRLQGAVTALRDVVLRQGTARLGPPDAKATAALNAINEPARLEELTLRVLTATSWRELLGLPAPRRRSRRRGS